MIPIKTDQVIKSAFTTWLKDHWKWILFGLIAAVFLWMLGQQVAAVGAFFSALWRWLFHRGKEAIANQKIKREEAARQRDRDGMVQDVNGTVADARSDDKALDDTAKQRAKSTGNSISDKQKMLGMLDQLDQMDNKP